MSELEELKLAYAECSRQRNELLVKLKQQPTQQKQFDDALRSLDFYRRRVEALQTWQSKMRDPERTIVCDIIANGRTLEPAGGRYEQPAHPLTDEQIEPIAIDVLGHGAPCKEDMELFAKTVRAIEAKHGITGGKK